MVNGTASVTPNFQLTMVNLTLVSCPDNSGKNKVDLTPDNNLVTKQRGGYISWLSKPCLFLWQFVLFLDKRSNYNTFVDSYFGNMKFIFPLTRACVWTNMDFNSANSSSFTSFPKGTDYFTFPQTIPVVESNPGLPARSSLSVSLPYTVNSWTRCTFLFFDPKM